MAEADFESGYVLSDLHIRAGRALPERIPEPLHVGASKGAFMVLNGDIFDFCRVPPPRIPEAVQGSLEWLGFLVRSYPNCRFIYVLGNHDGFSLFARCLAETARSQPNLECYPSHYVQGKTLFMHGDLVLSPEGSRPFDREPFPVMERRSRLLNLIYRMLIRMRAHDAVSLIYGKKRCARKIVRALREEPAAWTEGIEEIYFGHTHMPFRDYVYGEFRFHNSGTLYPGLECRMLKARLRPERSRKAVFSLPARA